MGEVLFWVMLVVDSDDGVSEKALVWLLEPSRWLALLIVLVLLEKSTIDMV